MIILKANQDLAIGRVGAPSINAYPELRAQHDAGSSEYCIKMMFRHASS